MVGESPARPLGRPLGRLLAPRHIAVFGGEPAEQVIRQCRLMGFRGSIWPVHPHRDRIEGLPCVRSVAQLPQPPDAAFVALPWAASIDVVGQLAALGAAGVVCYASGFAEIGGAGVARQQRLVEAAGGLALLGPNCYGLLNYLDGAALWPDGHGGRAVDRGVAIITQSGNLGLNLTMQRRGLPLAYLIAGGNLAGVGFDELGEALLDDDRVTAIGLHIEGLRDVAAFARFAALAQQRRIPLLALKSGSSRQGARVALSHTSSLSGSDELYDALFARFGIARVHDPATLLEALMICHVHSGLPGRRIASASCSGGEASLVADLAERRGLVLPDLGPAVTGRLVEVLGEDVPVGNPLDYHTYIWGDRSAQAECFSALLSAPIDLGLLVLDLPRPQRCAVEEWTTTLDAFVDAQRETGTRAAILSCLPEGLPEEAADSLLAAGIAPLHGIEAGLHAVAASATVGAGWTAPGRALCGPLVQGGSAAAGRLLVDEWQGKQLLAAAGVNVPAGRLLAAWDLDGAVEAALELGFPLALKAIGPDLAHKSERGALALGLTDVDQVRQEFARLSTFGPSVLLEQLVTGVLVELVVGLRHDPQFGYALTLGAGGVLVELLRDTVTLLLPVRARDVTDALAGLRVGALLKGFRGRPAADLAAVVQAVLAIARLADGGSLDERARPILELDVNPLLVLPAGLGVVAADVLLVRGL